MGLFRLLLPGLVSQRTGFGFTVDLKWRERYRAINSLPLGKIVDLRGCRIVTA